MPNSAVALGALSWGTVWLFISPIVKMLLILVIGHILVRVVIGVVKKSLKKSNFDQALDKFICKVLNIVLHVLVIVSALSAIGVSTTGAVAALSAAAAAVALALKDSLNNVAGGVLLLVAPRFRTGDYIAAGGDEGVVLDVDLLHTLIRTGDGRQVSIPNGVLLNSHITNYSREPQRRVDITFQISYESDAEIAKSIINKKVLEHPLVLTDNAPFVRVHSFGESAVNIVCRSWCNNSDYWTVYFDLIEQVRAEFDKNGISIPYNQLDVHIKDNK